MPPKKALITGITGQDGSYLADLLVEKEYEVFGTYRQTSSNNLERIRHLITDGKIKLIRMDLLDPGSIMDVLRTLNLGPNDEIYHEADQDNVGWSYEIPDYTLQTTVGGSARLMEGMLRYCPETKLFLPCSATMFRATSGESQNEQSEIKPFSPYACAKTAIYHLADYYRECHNLFVAIGILYSHDSPRRGSEYFLQKIARYALAHHRRMEGADKIRFTITQAELENPLDIGYARDYMEAAISLLQLDKPETVIISGGFGESAPPMKWWIEQAYRNVKLNWENYVLITDKLFREGPLQTFIGDNSRSLRLLPPYNHTSAEQLIYLIQTHLQTLKLL